jgi:hypothetical protein
MSNKESTCLCIDKLTLETARKVGLNVSKVSENVLIEAIIRLQRPKAETVLKSDPTVWGRGRDLNPGARLHRPMGYQATSPRPLFEPSWLLKMSLELIYIF